MENEANYGTWIVQMRRSNKEQITKRPQISANIFRRKAEGILNCLKKKYFLSISHDVMSETFRIDERKNTLILILCIIFSDTSLKL